MTIITAGTRRPARRVVRLLAAIALAIAVTTLVATTARGSRRIDVDHNFFGFSGRLTFNGNVTCDVLITIYNPGGYVKQPISFQGSIRGTIPSCSGQGTSGAILTPVASPGVYYQSFSGALPNITSMAFAVGDGSVPIGISLNTLCGTPLYGGSTDPRIDGVRFIIASGSVTGVDFNSSETLSRHRGGPICPADLTIRGTLATLLGPGPVRATLM